MKKALMLIVVLTAAVMIAACTSSTTNNSARTKDLSAALNAHFAAKYKLVDNFTRVSEANETPVYSGSFQDANGTFHSVIFYPANSTSDAQSMFEEQKAGYVDMSAMLNATVNANTSTRFTITANDTSISGWVVQPNTAGPYGLSLDTAYVLISQDMSMVSMTTNETAAVVTTGVG